MKRLNILSAARTKSSCQTVLCLCALGLGMGNLPAPAADSHDHQAHQTPRSPTAARQPAALASRGTNAAADRAPAKLPPLPPGVTELKFKEFFVYPVGDRGLDLTKRLRQLDGERVRILGYMVQQESPPPGRFLLTPMPAQVHEHDNSLADDLPPATVFVSVPTMRDQRVPHTSGLMLLTGTLSVGNRTEPDSRISVVRLMLDPPESSVTSNQ